MAASSHDNSDGMWTGYHFPRRWSLQSFVHYLKVRYVSDVFARRILRFSGPISSALEVGCGSASTLARLAARTGGDCHGVDRNVAVIEAARATYPTLRLETGDLFELPYAPKSFDVVFSIGLLEHFELEDQVKILETHIRLARRAVVLMTPADSLVMNTILFVNRRVLGRRGTWADEEVFSPAVLARKFPTIPFRSFKDRRFGNMIFWFGLRLDAAP